MTEMAPRSGSGAAPVGPDGAGALVVLPTYDERDNIQGIITAISRVLPAAHVLVVDDLSPDGTGRIAQAIADQDPRVHVQHRRGARGLGPAYLHGFGWALQRGYAAVFEMDADFSHQPRHLPAFVAALADHDLVLGCRYMPGGGVQGWGLHRQALSRAGNRYARTVLGLPFHDLTGGFKCFRREVLDSIDLTAVRSQGYGFQIELTWRAWRAGFRVAEVPIVFPDRVAGRSKMNLGIAGEALLGVWRMRLTHETPDERARRGSGVRERAPQ